MPEDQSLALIDAVRVALEKATSMQEVLDVKSKAAAAKTYARQAKLGKEIEDRMLAYILRAVAKLGEMLESGKSAGQITHGRNQKAVVDIDDHRVRLSEIGISKDLSSRAQKLARIPKPEFEARITELTASGKLSVANMLKSNGQQPVKKISRAPKEHPKAARIINLSDQGLSDLEVAKQVGTSPFVVRNTVEEEHIRRDTRKEAPEITPSMLAKLSDRRRVELAIKQQIQKLEKQYAIKLEEELALRLELKAGEWRKEQAVLKRAMNSRRGFMTRAIYKKILACLHPDWVTNEKQKARYEEAFREFAKLEKCILDEKESPTTYMHVPETMAEWDLLKKKTVAQRKAARTAKTDLSPRH